MSLSTIVANLAFFQFGWFACVLGGTGHWHWLGTLFVLALLTHHLSKALQPKKEFLLILTVITLGASWDSLLTASEMLRYGYGQWHQSIAPHWIVAIWGLFATTLNISMRWMKGRLIIAAIFGAIGGPLAYYAGSRLGAVEMSDMMLSLAILAFGWAVIMPLLMELSRHLDGFPVAETVRD